MYICESCLAKQYPDYRVHQQEWVDLEGACDKCGGEIKRGIFASEELLSGKVAVGKKPAAAVLDKSKCKYLVVDWESGGECRFCGNRDELVGVIAGVSFGKGHKDIGVYELVMLEHKAEIKIDVGEKRSKKKP